MENKTHQLHESMREKNKLLYKREYERSKAEGEIMNADIEFLGKISAKFEPSEEVKKGANKRMKYD